jgi:dolichyl-phosphate beta-glucosyltransferase
MEYSIVIPAYNEADRIISSLTQVSSFMKSYSGAFEVIVVDDGSTDKTVEIVKDYSKENPEVSVISISHKGKAAALVAGVGASKGDYIYLADADFSSPISELKKLSIWMKDQDFDIVIASREGTGANRIGEPLYRHIIGRVFNYIVQALALPGINDSQCGFKLFKSKAAKDIFSRLKVYGEQSKEIKEPFFGALDVEVLYLGRKFGYKIKEVGVTWTHVRTTRLNLFSNATKMVRDIIRIRIYDLKGAYRSK